MNSEGEQVAFKITFGKFKHSYNERPLSVVVTRQQHSCPVQLLSKYLDKRGTMSGPIFTTVDESSVSRSCFCHWLALAIQLCGLPPSRYKGHSFRIGAASHAADQECSDAQIRLLGRWKSNAFQKYIRVPTLSS